VTASSGAVTSAERLGPVGFGAAPIGDLYRPVSDAAARAAILGGNAERVYLDQDVRWFTPKSSIVHDSAHETA